jgi:hypothetical protein
VSFFFIINFFFILYSILYRIIYQNGTSYVGSQEEREEDQEAITRRTRETAGGDENSG